LRLANPRIFSLLSEVSDAAIDHDAATRSSDGADAVWTRDRYSLRCRPPDKTNSYQVQNLVSLPAANAGTIAAPSHDPNLQNGWGVAFNPTAFVWVSDNGTEKATLYDGN
jgi:hypothetical protein